MEIDELVTSVLEMAAHGQVGTPTIAGVHALLVLRARLRGLTAKA